MTFGKPPAEAVLWVFLALMAVAAACWAARYPRRGGAGVVLGVIVAVVLVNAAAFVAAFLAHVLPVGQMHYWLATTLQRLGW